jgi:hypothetical protein
MYADELAATKRDETYAAPEYPDAVRFTLRYRGIRCDESTDGRRVPIWGMYDRTGQFTGRTGYYRILRNSLTDAGLVKVA